MNTYKVEEENRMQQFETSTFHMSDSQKMATKYDMSKIQGPNV